MTIRQIAIGCDHAGYPYKRSIISVLDALGIAVLDFGTDSEESTDYPDFVHPVADSVESGRADLGIVLCGSGNGVAMTANKHQGIRAALCWTEELAVLARRHNNANVLALPVRFIAEELAVAITKAFLSADFEAGRHIRRIEKIPIS
ncbi:MAG: ribose 5-phosphate isomerase B [Saprospiraceae bacterium]|nr:ribose 5-phosphate isomerase B [Saprospiraceae bacterium]